MENHEDPSPTKQQWDGLCNGVKDSLLEEMGTESWYLIIGTVLTVSPRPHLLAEFWTHITNHDKDFSTPEAKLRLSHRLGDMLLKQMTLIGAPQLLSAMIPWAKVQSAAEGEDENSKEEKEGEMGVELWSNTSLPALHARGVDTITTIYGTLWRKIIASLGPHRSTVGLHELTIVYGLYLSDFKFLTPLETELVAYTSITCQGLRGPALWHGRGLGRVLGARGTDEENAKMRRIKDVVRGVKVAVAMCVEFCGRDMVQRSGLEGLAGWPNVGDVGRELGGWGED